MPVDTVYLWSWRGCRFHCSVAGLAMHNQRGEEALERRYADNMMRGMKLPKSGVIVFNGTSTWCDGEQEHTVGT